MPTTLEKLAETTGRLLKEERLTVVTAESCTGGGLGYWITSVPGSSAWFERGFITYSNLAKIELLGVNPETLSQFGAVSAETAREMAEGALKKSTASVSIAITGIAGPSTGGDASEKPVGTVWIAWSSRNRFATKALVNIFPGDRQAIRDHSIYFALDQLAQFIKRQPVTDGQT